MTTAEQATLPITKDAGLKSKKKIKIPLALRFIQWTYPKAEALAPKWAHEWFTNLFFSPPRYPIPAKEKDILEQAKRFTVSLGHQSVECYLWGEGPAILFVHGWAGRASQFKDFITSFTQAGYQVISFDAPAHGSSKGKKTSIIDFKNTILELQKKFNSIEAIVAHSLGGGASLFALTEGLKTTQLITIATPTLPDEIMHEFGARLNASPKSIAYLKARIPQVFEGPFHEFMSDRFVMRLTHSINWTIIHDTDDKEVSIKNAERLKEVYPSATMITTSGLGHVRILRDERVIEKCLEFVKR